MSAVWEFREIKFSPTVKRGEIRTLLTTMAEIERWEIDRVRVTHDGRRWIRLRRKTYLVARTA
jgi:hypothetical protein